jgi:hypothetical protein
VFEFDPSDESDDSFISEVQRRTDLGEFTLTEGDNAVRLRAKERLYPGGAAWWTCNPMPWRS